MMVEYRDNRDDSLSKGLVDSGGVMAFVLAGGQGERLRPLTDRRAKAAVPFGGMFRLVDFVLSNLVNSGVFDINLLVQYESRSLEDYLSEGWLAPGQPWRISLIGPEDRGRTAYKGTADAVYQNMDLIRARKPELVLVFGADHVYTMDVRPMIEQHFRTGAEVTVSALPMPVADASQFGTASIGPDWRIHDFQEKTPYPRSIPGRLGQTLVSMGNYLFDPDVLVEALAADAIRVESRHDFGGDILPRICARRRVYAYDFRMNEIPGLDGPSDYWRDVGTIGAFYRANLDLLDPNSHLNFSTARWPLGPFRSRPPAGRVVSRLYGDFGIVRNSLLSASAVVDGAFVRDSIIGPEVRVLSGAVIEESIILGRTTVNERAQIRRTIVDTDNTIREGDRIGFDLRGDLERFLVDDESGIVVIPSAEALPGADIGPVWSTAGTASSLRM